MNKNLTLRMGNCNHCKSLPHLIDLVASGAVDPKTLPTKTEPLTSPIEAYQTFDERKLGWLKVELTTPVS